MQTRKTELKNLTRTLGTVIRHTKHAQLGVPLERAQLGVLWLVAELSVNRPSDLAGHLGLDLSTVSRHVSALEQAGHLSRTEDPHDRRSRRLEITKSGRDTLTKAWETRVAAFGAAVAGWPDEDLATLTRLLTRLAEDLNPGKPTCLAGAEDAVPAEARRPQSKTTQHDHEKYEGAL